MKLTLKRLQTLHSLAIDSIMGLEEAATGAGDSADMRKNVKEASEAIDALVHLIRKRKQKQVNSSQYRRPGSKAP